MNGIVEVPAGIMMNQVVDGSQVEVSERFFEDGSDSRQVVEIVTNSVFTGHRGAE